MFPCGRYELYAIETGRFRLDGGSMFGVVPATLWRRGAVPDEHNRITLAMRSLLAVDRSAGRVILVDTGAGDKWDDAERDRFAFELDGDPLGRGLAAAGVSNDDVTDVIVTHLHFDHNAGLTRWIDAPGAGTVLRFDRARHWVHAAHLAHALAPSPKDRGSFLPRDFQRLVDDARFSLLEGTAPPQPFDGVQWFVAHGHTPYQLLPRFVSDEGGVQYLADLIPTAQHLPLAWVMAFDNEPLRTVEEKRRLYSDCAREPLVLCFEHDPDVVAARVHVTGRRPELAERLTM